MAVPMASPAGGDYDAYAKEYARGVASRELGGGENDPYGLLSPMLDFLGDLRQARALDAGCGARVTSRGYWRPRGASHRNGYLAAPD